MDGDGDGKELTWICGMEEGRESAGLKREEEGYVFRDPRVLRSREGGEGGEDGVEGEDGRVVVVLREGTRPFVTAIVRLWVDDCDGGSDDDDCDGDDDDDDDCDDVDDDDGDGDDDVDGDGKGEDDGKGGKRRYGAAKIKMLVDTGASKSSIPKRIVEGVLGGGEKEVLGERHVMLGNGMRDGRRVYGVVVGVGGVDVAMDAYCRHGLRHGVLGMDWVMAVKPMFVYPE